MVWLIWGAALRTYQDGVDALGRASVNLVTLQTITVEIDAILNDCPLTYAFTDIRDLDPLTLCCLPYGRLI